LTPEAQRLVRPVGDDEDGFGRIQDGRDGFERGGLAASLHPGYHSEIYRDDRVQPQTKMQPDLSAAQHDHHHADATFAAAGKFPLPGWDQAPQPGIRGLPP
jgi:hypothetical protein